MSRVGPLKLKIMLFCGEVTAMGPGKAELLEAIEREGSISAAGRVMDMSYRRAWSLVDTMNRCWSEPVVQTAIGGGGKGGAKLTPFGARLLGAGESSGLMAEQFGLYELLAESAAVDSQEGSVAPAMLVDVARDEFLARAGLADQEHGGVTRGQALELPLQNFRAGI